MRTLNVSISDNEYKVLGLKSDTLKFAEFKDVIRRALAVENLKKCVELSEKYGLSDITLEEINEEIKAIRKDAKTRR